MLLIFFEFYVKVKIYWLFQNKNILITAKNFDASYQLAFNH